MQSSAMQLYISVAYGYDTFPNIYICYFWNELNAGYLLLIFDSIQNNPL